MDTDTGDEEAHYPRKVTKNAKGGIRKNLVDWAKKAQSLTQPVRIMPSTKKNALKQKN
jgi:hypothetical protein